MNIGLITTMQTNIGDDMIRAGICKVLEDLVGTENLHLYPVNKHMPWGVYPAWHPGHLARLCDMEPHGQSRLVQFLDGVTSKFGHSKFDECQAIVQCGAPVLWPTCHMCEWRFVLWDHVVGRLHERIPVLNLAAGSCYPWENQPTMIENDGDVDFLKSILRYCRLTTVRDALAHRLVRSLGWTVELVPCSALLASIDRERAPMDENAPILFNYMLQAGHYTWGQEIDAQAWRNVVRKLMTRLRRRHNVVMLCHDEVEAKLAAEIAPDCEALFPKTVSEYLEQVSVAKGAVCNRMHASVAMAGLGIPSVAVCTDSRLLMVEAIGLPSFYVKDVSAEMIEDTVENLISAREREKDRLRELQVYTKKRYFDLVSAVIPDELRRPSSYTSGPFGSVSSNPPA